MTVNWNYFRGRTRETKEGWKARQKGKGGQKEAML